MEIPCHIVSDCHQLVNVNWAAIRVGWRWMPPSVDFVPGEFQTQQQDLMILKVKIGARVFLFVFFDWSRVCRQ